MTEPTYTIATDGACQGNPGPAGWAWVGEDGRWAAGSFQHATNNIGELTALLRAIEMHAHVPNLLIQADSQYAINSYETWMHGHASRDWKTRGGRQTKNMEILQRLLAAKAARREAGLPDVQLEWVKGHAGHVRNSWSDERCVRARAHSARRLEHEWSTDAGQALLDVTVPPSGGEDVVRR